MKIAKIGREIVSKRKKKKRHIVKMWFWLFFVRRKNEFTTMIFGRKTLQTHKKVPVMMIFLLTKIFWFFLNFDFFQKCTSKMNFPKTSDLVNKT